MLGYHCGPGESNIDAARGSEQNDSYTYARTLEPSK